MPSSVRVALQSRTLHLTLALIVHAHWRFDVTYIGLQSLILDIVFSNLPFVPLNTGQSSQLHTTTNSISCTNVLVHAVRDGMTSFPVHPQSFDDKDV
jgi:hypothetical protein